MFYKIRSLAKSWLHLWLAIMKKKTDLKRLNGRKDTIMWSLNNDKEKLIDKLINQLKFIKIIIIQIIKIFSQYELRFTKNIWKRQSFLNPFFVNGKSYKEFYHAKVAKKLTKLIWKVVASTCAWNISLPCQAPMTILTLLGKSIGIKNSIQGFVKVESWLLIIVYTTN